ncbi:hypothetical protein [Tunturiibacter psychrotolerans]
MNPASPPKTFPRRFPPTIAITEDSINNGGKAGLLEFSKRGNVFPARF